MTKKRPRRAFYQKNRKKIVSNYRCNHRPHYQNRKRYNDTFHIFMCFYPVKTSPVPMHETFMNSNIRNFWKFNIFIYLCSPVLGDKFFLRAISSVGLEHLPYKQGVAGSNPASPTKKASANDCRCFFYARAAPDGAWIHSNHRFRPQNGVFGGLAGFKLWQTTKIGLW